MKTLNTGESFFVGSLGSSQDVVTMDATIASVGIRRVGAKLGAVQAMGRLVTAVAEGQTDICVMDGDEERHRIAVIVRSSGVG